MTSMMADNISQDEIDSKLMELSRPVEDVAIEELKAILPGLGIQKQRIAEQKVLNKLFSCVQKAKIPDVREAVTCFCQIVNLLGWSDLTSLERYTLSGYDVRTKYPLVDCRLVVYGFVSNLNDLDFDILRTYICQKCNLASDRCKTCPSLVEIIFDEGVIKDQNDITKMHHIACRFNRNSLFDEYCERHKIPKPDDFCVVSTEPNMKLLEEIIVSKTSHLSNAIMSTTSHIKAPEQVSGQQEPSGDTRYTTTPNPAGETGKHNGNSMEKGEDGLSLEPALDVPSNPIQTHREDDGSGLLPREVEDDRPKRREDSEEDIKTESDNGEVKKGSNEDCISDSGSEVKLESVTDTNAEEREQRKKRRIMCVKRLILGALTGLFGLGAIVFLIFLLKEVISQSQNRSVNVTDSSLVALDPNGFEGELHNIQLRLETEDENIEVEVYKQPCGEVSVSSHILMVRKMHELVSEYFNRQAYNYNGEDMPIYGVKGSVLNFTLLSSNASDANPSFCPRLSVFNNNNLYQDAIGVRVNIEGNIAQSPCFPVNTSDTPAVGTWSYTFENSEYIYVTIEKGGDVVVNGMISGTIRLYKKTADLVEGCTDSEPLIYESTMCTVNICKKRCPAYKPFRQCIFLQSNSNSNIEISYETDVAPLTFLAVICLSMMLFLILLLSVLVPSLACSCYKKTRSPSIIPYCAQCSVESNSSSRPLSPKNGTNYQTASFNGPI